MNGCREGETIIIDIQTIKADKLGVFTGNVYRKSDGVIIASGKQTLALER